MKFAFPLGLALAAVPVALPAQNSLPGLENFTLERPRAPQPAPTASATPAPSPSPSSAATAVPIPPPPVVPIPRATATPVPRASTTSAPVAAPTAQPVTAAAPIPVPTPTGPAAPLPSPSPSTTPVPTTAAAGGSAWPVWLALAAAVVIGAVALLLWRRRRDRAANEVWEEPSPSPVAAAPPPVPAPVAPVPVPAAPKAPGGLITSSLRPELTFDLQPVGAGIDALRASVDFVLAVRNTGRAPAYQVAIEVWLIGAGGDPRGDLAQVFAQPQGVTLLPPFDLPASAAADLSGQSLAPREALGVITAGERKLFVPLLAVRASYHDSRGQPAIATAAFMVGVARPGQERLAPLALDRGTRGYDALAARKLD